METAKQAMLAVRVPDEIMKRLDSLATLTGRTKTFYVREAILEHLDDLEDLFLARRERDEVLSGRSVSIPLAEVMRQYGLED